ncbi:MAG: hypothetical protein O3B47_04815, partial [bacterium]|nr:hypothetical protein [bacterium]
MNKAYKKPDCVEPADEVFQKPHQSFLQADVTRREFSASALKGSARIVLLMALSQMGVLSAKEALAAEHEEHGEHGEHGEHAEHAQPAGHEEHEGPDPHEIQKLSEKAEHLSHDSFGLVTLDLIGTLGFVDAIVAIARKSDSTVQKLCVLAGLPTYNTGELEQHNGKHMQKFPIENMHLALILNIIRAASFGETVRKHTLDEFNTTLKGVGLLMGLTSMAKGIVAAESKTGEMAKSSGEQIVLNPEKILADSIFQLTMIAATTQLPLTAFGNAAIGNSEFGEVSAALDTMYLGLLPDKDMEINPDFIAQIRGKLDKIGNPIMKKRVEKILDSGSFDSVAGFGKLLKAEAKEHANDLMTILMSTSCDDAQAALGDAGPLVGLYQSFGTDFLKVIPSILPYTFLIGIERAIFAAKRAGIPSSSVFTGERFAYMKNFLLATWKNLILYFATVAPKISSKISGGEVLSEPRNGNGVGRDFTLVEQVFKDVEGTLGTVMDAILGSFNGNTLDIRKVRSAIKRMQYADRDFKRELGEQLLAKVSGDGGVEVPVRSEGVVEIRQRILGRKSVDPELSELQTKIETLAIDQNEGAIEEFALTLKTLRAELGGELQYELEKLKKSEGRSTPSIQAVATLLKDNPKISKLLDFNHWHHRIGAELTDTMFVVFLQGLHLPFIINTAERFIYNNDRFKGLPLVAQEWISVAFNDGVSMFADNWADCVAHSKWLTTMYFNALGKYETQLAEKYPEIKKTIAGGYFKDLIHDDADEDINLIPNRFSRRKQQFAALISHLKTNNPEDVKFLDNLLGEYMEKIERFYWKAMNIAMLTAVTGGGKA